MSRPVFEWNKKRSSSSSSSQYEIEKKWMIAYEHTTSTNGTFYFKAGNKDYTLDGNAKSPSGKAQVSEFMLKKKYE
jgi:hypothetical protein